MSEEDVAATAGLRRFVVHARDMLRATQMHLPSGQFGYGKHWEPALINRHAAHLLAEQALTLVLDCLPQATTVSADEVTDLQTEFGRQIAALRNAISTRDEALAKQAKELELTQQARDEEIEAREEAEAVEADLAGKWERAVELAEKDAAAAIRLLLARDEEPPDKDAP